MTDTLNYTNQSLGINLYLLIHYKIWYDFFLTFFTFEKELPAVSNDFLLPYEGLVLISGSIMPVISVNFLR